MEGVETGSIARAVEASRLRQDSAASMQSQAGCRRRQRLEQGTGQEKGSKESSTLETPA